MTTSERIAILRRCRRCMRWRSIDAFSELGRLCLECMRTTRRYLPAAGFAITRGIAITAKGRETLREMERPAA